MGLDFHIDVNDTLVSGSHVNISSNLIEDEGE